MMLHKDFNLKALTAGAIVFAGSMMGMTDVTQAQTNTNQTNASQNATSQENLSASEIKAQKIKEALDGAVNLSEKEIDERFETVSNILGPVPDNPNALLRDPFIAKAYFEGMAPLLKHNSYSVRLGAIVVLGQVAVESAGCAGKIVSLLTPLRNDSDKDVRAYAAGTINSLVDELGAGVLSNPDKCVFGTARDGSEVSAASNENNSPQQPSARKPVLSVEQTIKAVKTLLNGIQALPADEVITRLAEVKQNLGTSLAVFGEPGVAETLYYDMEELLQHKEEAVRLEAIMFMGAIAGANPNCAEKVVELLLVREEESETFSREDKLSEVILDGLIDKYDIDIRKKPQECIFPAP